jgi:hypothetical protein
MNEARAINTQYAGRLFRSRLEARWAVFYNALGIPWMYEPEGFLLSDGADSVAYLPDFYLPTLNCFIEIKPQEPSSTEQHKAAVLAQETGTRVFIFFGMPGHHVFDGYPSGQPGYDSAYLWDGTYLDETGTRMGAFDNCYSWCVCLRCGEFGIEFQGRSERLSCRCYANENRCYTYDDARVLKAYDRANSARFRDRIDTRC